MAFHTVSHKILLKKLYHSRNTWPSA